MMNTKSLIFIFIGTIMFQFSRAQCSTCIPDYGCGTPEGGICDSIAPPATVGQAYDESVTFFMPQTIPVTGQPISSVDLLEITINGVAGLPPGLSWTCNDASCQYFPPSNMPDSQYGCVQICGTPFGSPGIYNITVFLTAVVDAGIFGTVTENETYELTMELLPGVGGNQSFSFSPTVSCGATDVQFETNFPSGGNPNFSYQWDFGNGFQSSSEVPPVISYTTPGIYEISKQTKIDTFLGSFDSFTVAASDCDDIFSAPDFYFRLFLDGNMIFESDVIDNQYPPVTFNFSPIVLLRDTNYTIEVWESDSFLEGSDDFCGTVHFTGDDVGDMVLLDPPLAVEFTINRPMIEYDDVDTLIIHPNPVKPNINQLTESDLICAGDTIFLMADNGEIFQWFNDTITLSGANDSIYKATSSGKYWVEIFDENTCRAVSEVKELEFLPSPLTPSIVFLASQSQLVASNYSSSNTVQWYFNGVAIPGGEGQFLDVTENGTYGLQYTNAFGCKTKITEFELTGVSVEDFAHHAGFSSKVYPNPADGIFNLDFEFSPDRYVQLEVYNQLGQRIKHTSFTTVESLTRYRIDLSNQERGVYLLRMRSGNSQVTHRLMLQ